MGSTTSTAVQLKIVGTGFAGARTMAAGVTALSSGTASIATGLNNVHYFAASECSGVANQPCVISVTSDLPTTSGTVAVQGSYVKESDNSVTDGGSLTFSWIAIGD